MTKTHYILTIILLVILNTVNGQTDEHLQIIHERNEKINPSMVKDSSKLNRQSELDGYKLVLIDPSPCNASLAGKPINERIANKEFSNDTLNIEIALIANCCASFLGEIEIKNDTTLNIIFSEYGSECFCTCCFNLIYSIVTKLNRINSYELNGNPIIESDSIFVEEKNRITQELEYYKNGNLKNRIFVQNGDTIGKSYFDKNGAYIRGEKYKNGQLIKED